MRARTATRPAVTFLAAAALTVTAAAQVAEQDAVPGLAAPPSSPARIAQAASRAAPPGSREAAWWAEHTELPRWPDTGVVPDDPNQPLYPYAIDLTHGGAMPPTSGVIASPPEYDRVDGVLFEYGGGWSQTVADCVAALTSDPQYDEIAYVVVANANTQANATTKFQNTGADMSKVQFILEPNNSIWLRDYGPHFIWQDGAHAIADSHYYPSRPLDNFIPTLLADDSFQIPVYPMGLYYSGGNFQPGPNRWAFDTSLIFQDNPGFSQTYIEQLYNQYQGIDTLHIFPKLPNSVDGTGHIDMWMYLVDQDDVIISQFKPGSNATAILITDNAAIYMQGLGFTVSRTPAWNVGWTHYTYTNAFRVNDRIFVPIYGLGNPNYLDEDAAAMAAWQAAAGSSVTLVPIDCYDIIPAAGAIHCIVMQVPEHSATTPSAVVCSPVGGELLASGASHDVHWGASDDQNVTMVDLAYSTDGGASFPNPIAYGEANDGHFDWTVPALDTTQAKVQVTAYDGSGNQSAAQSPATFEIARKPQRVYDFSTGANADKWGWGYRSNTWSDVDATRYPATAATPIDQLDPNAYAELAASDATGGDGDPNRYVSPNPGGGKETTHIFEFVLTEPPTSILDLGIDWEGYGDQCIQMEMYVWNDAAGNWSDGKVLLGENMYCANYAGNRDDDLITHIRTNLTDYVGPNDGKLTLMLYGERPAQESFHDYLAVTVTHDDCQADLGYRGPGDGILSMCGAPLATGNTADLWLRNVPPGTAVWMFFGTAANPKPFAGGSIVPWPPLTVAAGAADGTGQVFLPGLNGGGGPASFYVQFVYLDPSQPQGFGFSNAMRLDYLP